LVLFQVLFAPGLAISRGGAPERLIAFAFLIDSVATVLVQQGRTIKFHSPEPAIFVIDLVMVLVAAQIAIRANRWWPIWFTACHMIGVLSHVVRLIDVKIATWPYYVTASYGAYPLWLLVIAGTIGHEVRLRKYGIDPSWKGSSRVLMAASRELGRIKP
jgi:hypothetical protein